MKHKPVTRRLGSGNGPKLPTAIPHSRRAIRRYPVVEADRVAARAVIDEHFKNTDDVPIGVEVLRRDVIN